VIVEAVACVHNRIEVVDFLLAQGADINAIVPGLDMKATVLHRVAREYSTILRDPSRQLGCVRRTLKARSDLT
jgi:hypothetical protein